jgi:hypothetical protein
MRPQFFHIRFGVFAPHNSLLPCFLSHSVLPIREGALLTLCYNLAMDEDDDDDLNACRVDQNHAEAFHHHGTSGGWPKDSSGPRKSFLFDGGPGPENCAAHSQRAPSNH